MNTGTKIEETPKEQPKSKRLSSLIWIFVLWGFIYLISQLSGTTPGAMFYGITNIFGLWPATGLLILSVFTKNYSAATILKFGSLFIYFSGFIIILVLDAYHIDPEKSIIITNFLHWLIAGLSLIYMKFKTAYDSRRQ